jgi:hypothetical protein
LLGIGKNAARQSLAVWMPEVLDKIIEIVVALSTFFKPYPWARTAIHARCADKRRQDPYGILFCVLGGFALKRISFQENLENVHGS